MFKKQENLEICESVRSFKLTPDKLKQMILLAQSLPPESPAAQEAMAGFLQEENMQDLEVFDEN